MQHIRIADLTTSNVPLSTDAPYESMDIDNQQPDHLPDGAEPGDGTQLSRDEERALTRESTAGFTGKIP